MNRIVIGIDLGSRLSGNTVLSIFDHGRVHFMRVDKNVCADTFSLNAVQHYHPQHVFLDAPLSLPGVYRGIKGCKDYHFRKADRELKAMSPMFLGGLTARAIELSEEMRSQKIPVFETYPRIMARKQGLESIGYKKGTSFLKACQDQLRAQLNPEIKMESGEMESWHHIDAFLAMLSALAFAAGQPEVYGDKKEGLIHV